MATELIAWGMVFEIEELMTGKVSMTCEWPHKDEVLSIQICDNGPAVPDCVDKLVADAHVKGIKIAQNGDWLTPTARAKREQMEEDE